jgi:hypothetical protein
MKNDYDVDYEQYGNAGNGSLRWISMLVMIMVVFGFFSLVWYAYDGGVEGTQDETIAMIAPEQERYKIKPLDAGGMPVENKDIEAYQLMRRTPDVQTEVDKVETLLSDNEKPLKPVVQPDQPNPAMANEMAQIDGTATMSPVPSQPETLVQAPLTPEVTQDTLTQAQLELEEKARALQALEKELAEKQAAQNALMQAQQAQLQEKRQQQEKVAAEPTIDDAIKQVTVPEVTKTVDPVALAPKNLAAAAPAERPLSSVQKQPVMTTKTITQATPAKPAPAKPVAAAPATAPVATGGGAAYIQFAAMRSAADAGRVWAELKAKHPELAPYSYYTEPVQVAAGGTLHRLRAKGFASRTQAVNICNAIKSRGQDCLVAVQ